MNITAFALACTTAFTCATSFAQDAAKPTNPHPFFTRTEIALVSTEVLARSVDAYTTNEIINNPCHCWHEANVPSFTGTKAGSFAYSEGIAAVYIGASYALHRMHHDKLAKLVLAVDVTYDGANAVRNLRIERGMSK